MIFQRQTLAIWIAAPHLIGERRRACAATEAVDPAGCGAIRGDDVYALSRLSL